MGAYNNLDTAVLGLMVGIEALREFIETLRNADLVTIPYGAPVFQKVGDPVNAFLAHRDTVVLTQSVAFTATNVFTMVLDGVTLAAITWVTNSVDMYTAINALLVASLPATAVVTTDSSAFTITVFNPGYSTTLTATTAAGGGSAVTSTPVYSSSMIFMGVTGFTQLSFRDSAGGYPTDYQMNSAYLGQIYVQTSLAVKSGQPAYVVMAPGATQGQFTNVSTNNFNIKAFFRSSTTGAGLAIVELKGKQNFAGTL